MNTVDTKVYAGLIVEAVKPIHRRFKAYTEFEDLSQEAWLWLLDNADKAAELAGSDQRGLVRELRLVADRWARREKAAYCGYRVDDEHFYGLKQLRELMPYVFEPDLIPPDMGIEIDRVFPLGVDYSNLETSLADVRSALDKVHYEHKTVLRFYFYLGYTPDELAEYYHEEPDVSLVRVHRALMAVQRRLGGSNPWHATVESSGLG